jgi:hypothetical protein
MQGNDAVVQPAKRHGFIRTDEGERLRVDQDGIAETPPVQAEMDSG